MSYQNLNQYNFNKIGFRPVNEIIDINLASDELNYDTETVFSTKLIAEDDGNRMPFNFDFDYSGNSIGYLSTDVIVSKNYYNPNKENLLSNQKIYSLCDVGLTGIDNGLTQSITGETLEFNTGLYANNADIYDNLKFDRRLKLHPITGFTTNINRLYNDNSYSYSISKDLTLTTGIYSVLNGGFYQGFYKLFGYDYEIFPERVDLGWSVELLVRYRWTGDTLVGLNARYPENKGTFFYLGARAENKFYHFAEGSPESYSGYTRITSGLTCWDTCGCAKPLPTPSQTPTITPTPSSFTPTNTITPTQTQTITPTNTITPSQTQTPTQTITPTNTITPTQTITPTNTVTPTQTKTPTNTITPTNTVTSTQTITPTNTPTNTVTPSPPPPLLLDLYPNAAAAYSLRKLRTAYTGSAIRVRASTSGAEGDVGFDVNNTISASSTVTVTAVGTSGLSIGQQVTFSTFWNAGGSNQNVFVTTWYDQSGNARDAAQTTQANQPQIVSSGSIINLNSKPTVQFNNQQFITRASFNVSSVSTFTLMNKYNITGYGGYLRNVTSTGNSFAIVAGLSGVWASQCVNFTNGIDVNPNPTRRSVGKTLPTNQYLENWIYNTNIRKIYENNINLTTSTGLTGWGGKTNFTLGSISYDGNPGIEKVEIQELIIYDLDQTANLSAINTNINTHYAIY